MQPRSQWSAAIQTQGATGERSPEIHMPLVICNQSVECNRAKGPSGPFCAPVPMSVDTGWGLAPFAGVEARFGEGSFSSWLPKIASSDGPTGLREPGQ